MARHPLHTIYRIATRLVTPLSGAFFGWRAQRGKEDRARLGERKGYASAERPQGRLAWLHGASVGESLALLPLVRLLGQRGLRVVVTTGTVSSAQVMQQRLPADVIHQYMPLDLPRFLRRFLEHWQPDIVMLMESELWPNLIADVHKRGIPLVLINARMSARSYGRWKKAPGLIGALLTQVDLCLAQSSGDAARFLGLGAPRVQVAGNLKYDGAPPSADAGETAALTAAIGARPVWVAASTHEGEELIAAQAHKALATRFPELLTLIVPRHPQRAGEIEKELKPLGLALVRRSGAEQITARTRLYLCDTIGEMGLFLRVAKLVFLGKSLTGEGGQNPIEAAKLGCAILHGPHIDNFSDTYSLLDDAHGAAEVEDGAALAKALEALLSDAGKLRLMARSALESVARQSGAADAVMRAIEPYIGQMLLERHR